MKEQITKLLEVKPYARERAHRNEAMAYLTKKSFPILDDISIQTLQEIIAYGISMDRAFRDIQLKNKELRGADYDEGERLEQEYLVTNGYGGNFKIKV